MDRVIPFAERDLLRLLPKVLRARDFHLYLEGGKRPSRRLMDLWLQGGRAVLGHKPPNVVNELKNAAERGLFTSLPHPMERRFIKALEVFFPGRVFRLYGNEDSLCRALTESDEWDETNRANPTEAMPFPDPAFPMDNAPGKLSLWRPFLEPPPEIDNTPVLIPVLPWPLGPAVLVLEKDFAASFPDGELIAPVLLAPAARAIHNLAAAQKAFAENHPRFLKIENALKNSPWRRRGIYLTVNPDMEKEKYKELFLRFLDGGCLIPPSPREPAILPRTMSAGEEAKLAELLGLGC